jgi:hypothetical protein
LNYARCKILQTAIMPSVFQLTFTTYYSGSHAHGSFFIVAKHHLGETILLMPAVRLGLKTNLFENAITDYIFQLPLPTLHR